MRRIIEFAVKNRVTVFMIVFGILLLGKISYDELGTDLFPDMKNPRLFIEITSGERPPEEIEKSVVKSLEALVIRQSDVVSVSSVIKAGSARITVDYGWKTDMNDAFLDLQRSVSAFNQNDAQTEINVSQNDPNSDPVILLALSHNEMENLTDLRKVADSYIKNKLIRVPGVADVSLSGDLLKNLTVKTDLYKLEAYNLSLNTISSKIKENNQSISGGTIRDMGRQYIVKGVSSLTSVDDFRKLIVGYKNVAATSQDGKESAVTKAPVYLEDVADVSMQDAEPDNIVRINGKRAIGLSIYKEIKYNTVKVVDNINAALSQIERNMPGYKFEVITNQGEFISTAISDVKYTALIGILLAVMVIYLFLRRIGTTLIVSIAMPISIVATFNLMYFGGLTINIMTLGGLALGAGMLVDNAIVVIESIFRNQENGLDARQAAIKGTTDVALAVSASTLTTIVVFLPIVYMHGASGELFKDQAWTVTFSLLSSLFVAILVIPMLYYLIIGKAARKDNVVSSVNEDTTSKMHVSDDKQESENSKAAGSLKFLWYEPLLRSLLKRRKSVLASAVAILAVTAMLTPMLKSEFMPRPEGKSFYVDIKTAEGSPLEYTSSVTMTIENIIKKVAGEDKCTVYSHTGKGANTANSLFDGDNSARIKVNLTDDAPEINFVMDALTNYVDNNGNVDIAFAQDNQSLSSFMGTESAPIVVEVRGEELEKIAEITEMVKQRMESLTGLTAISTSIEDGAPEVNIDIDRVFCGINDITVSTVIDQVSQKLSGVEAGQMDHNGELVGIKLSLPEIDLYELNTIPVASGEKTYALCDLASVNTSNAPREIIRNNQVRTGRITADMQSGYVLDEVARAVKSSVSDINLPNNYSVNITGEEEMRRESMNSLMFALILSVILVYMVLASQFESLLSPFIILLTIPLAVVGAVLLFLITGTTLNIMGVIGMVMLVGIAVNNSIILVDRINQLKESMTLEEAVVEAGKQRIRPIIMTTSTTILALLPLCISFGQDTSLRAPMAIAVIGGLITATLMSLIVIPCLYYVFKQSSVVNQGPRA